MLFIIATHLFLAKAAPDETMFKLLFGNFQSLLDSCKYALLGVFTLFPSKDSIYMLGQFWSLSVEFQFYIGIFLIILILHAVCFFKKSDAVMKNNFISKVLLILSLAIYLLIIYKRIALAVGISWDNRVIAYLRDMRFDFIALGFLLYYIPKKNLRF